MHISCNLVTQDDLLLWRMCVRASETLCWCRGYSVRTLQKRWVGNRTQALWIRLHIGYGSVFILLWVPGERLAEGTSQLQVKIRFNSRTAVIFINKWYYFNSSLKFKQVIDWLVYPVLLLPVLFWLLLWILCRRTLVRGGAAGAR